MIQTLLLEFVRVFNWTDKSLEFKLSLVWADAQQPFFQQMVRGQMQDQSLKFKVPVKTVISRPNQLMSIYIVNPRRKLIGTASLGFDSTTLKHKILYLPLTNSDSKILQVNIGVQASKSLQPSNIKNECDRVVQQTIQRKIMTNIQLKRNDIFIKNRQKFLTEYSRSKSRSNTKDFPSKITNLLQQVRQIKNALRTSHTRPNSHTASHLSAKVNPNTPSRSSLESIEQKPVKYLQRAPKSSHPLLLAKPSRRGIQSRDLKPNKSPGGTDVYGQYGLNANTKRRIPQGKMVSPPQFHQRKQTPTNRQRPTYLIRQGKFM